MTLTEEQRAALKRVLAYMNRMYGIASPYYGCTEDANILRAMIDSSDHIVEPDELIGFDLERARGLRDFLQDDCAEVGDVWAEMIAEIERLRAENEELQESLTEAYLLGSHKKAKELASRIKDLEDALVEERASRLSLPEYGCVPTEEEYMAIDSDNARCTARQQLREEGKIGPGTVAPPCWQITEERKEAIRDAEIALRDAVLDSNDPHCWDAETAVLRGMLMEAE